MATNCCPKTFTGFCLNDNTPIAITLDNGVVISWTNLVTGTITPGNPPAGTGICEVPSTVTVEPLTCVKDAVTVCQGTDPWTVDGTVELGATTLAALETITVNQGTSPWVVTGSFSSGPLTCETDSITVCPPVSGFGVSVLNFPASVEVSNDAGNPLPVSGTVALDAPTLAALEVITVNQGTSPWVVSATDFDIRNLACGQDAVDACVTFDYPEDSLHVSGDTGAFVLAVRNDAGTPLAADGDYIPFTTDATGALRVNASFTGDISVALDCATDSVTICPPVSGTFDVEVLNTVAVSGIVSVTEPVTVDAVDFDIRNLDCVIDSVTVCPGLDPITVDGVISTVVGFQTRSDTYTVPASGVIVDASANPLKSYAIQVTGTGASATLWDVRLEGSLDGVNFTQIIQHTNTDGNGMTKWAGASLAPSLYFRSRCASLTLGPATNIVVVILGSN